MKKIINIVAIAMIVGVTFISDMNVGSLRGGSLFGMSAVSAQTYMHGQTGDVDTDTTNNNTCYSFSYNMRKGSRDSTANNEVTKLQEALVQLGYLNADPTGYFGNVTYNAVRAFQSAKGLLSSGFVGTYTRTALYNATCNGNNPYPTPIPSPTPTPTPVPTPNPIYINLTPSTLPPTVYDKDSNGGTLSYIILTDSNNYLSNLNSSYVSIVNTNIPNITVALDKCNTNNAVNGLAYIKYYTGLCSNNNITSVSVNMRNSVASMVDNTYYYFTLRINQGGTYTDKQYSFTYKKLNSNTVCAYSYKNGVYGCYYYNDCNYCNGINCTYMMCVDNNTNNGGNNNVCTSGYVNGTYGCYYNVTCNSSYDHSKGYYVNNCTYINGFDGFIDKRNYDVNTNYNNSSGYYNGTNILY